MIARWRDQLDRQIIVFCRFLRWQQKNSLKNCSQDGAGGLLPPLLGLLPVLQEGVVVLALWDVLGSITLLGDLVVDKSELATLLSGRDSVQADVELGTVVRVRVLGVWVELTELISRSLLGTSEPVVGLVSVSLAVLPVGDLGPVADAAVLVEPESGGTSVLLGGSVDASVEDVAHAGVRVRVEAVQTGAQVARALGRLKLQPVAAVNVEVMIARLPLSAEGVEDKTIRAEPFLWDVVETIIVFVALNRVREVAVPLRTSEVGLG